MSLSAAQKAFLRHLVAAEWEKGAGESSAMLTDAGFAEVIGVHPNTVKLWKTQPAFQEALKVARREFSESKDYLAYCMRARAMEQLWKEFDRAPSGKPEKRHYLDLIFAQTKQFESDPMTVSYDDMNDDDLVAAALKRDISPIGLSPAELRRLANKEGNHDDPDSRDPYESSDSDPAGTGIPSGLEPAESSGPPKRRGRPPGSKDSHPRARRGGAVGKPKPVRNSGTAKARR
jgi:hypothetical protein